MHGYDDAYGAYMAFLGHTSSKEDEGQLIALGEETVAAAQVTSSPLPAVPKCLCAHRATTGAAPYGDMYHPK